ncbi:Hsp70binding protein 1like [Caligus rogercresseyi]|uniref:Hsp70binding protein 1like n=1 Tax=Caligus rogercresseyi TaxID=217165 RepID=A0A7T8QS60_CALRO|nr:Hsp70binding protein 1like [Caligus rogercresseyi]
MSDRKPRDLRGLLKFCAEYTKKEDAPGDSTVESMDPERQEFLAKVLKDLSVDVIDEFTRAIQVLTSPKVSDETQEDQGEALYVLECIEDWVGQIDMAVNFHKVGGFEAVLHTLQSPHEALRAQGAHLISELSQNNPYCQDHLTQDGFLQILLHSLESDTPKVQVKALYAISCILRQSTKAQTAWKGSEGPSRLVKALMSDVPKLNIKASFLMSALIAEKPSEFAPLFSSMGTHLQLSGLIVRNASNEQVAMALFTLLSHPQDSSTLCDLSSDTSLKDSLIKNIREMENKEECMEERDYYKKILQIVFHSDSDRSVDR